MHEGTNGCETSVTTADSIVVLHFRIPEEGENEIGVEVLQQECGRPLTELALCKSKQQSKAVAIGGDRAWTRMTLHQVIGKELLQQSTEAGTRAEAILSERDWSEASCVLIELSPWLTLWVAARVSARAEILNSTFGVGMLR